MTHGEAEVTDGLEPAGSKVPDPDRFDTELRRIVRRQRVRLAVGLPIAYVVGRVMGAVIGELVVGCAG